MLPREELVGLMIFLAICFIIVIIAIYIIYKDKKKIEEKKEDLLNAYREWCETDHIVLNKCNIKGKDNGSEKEAKDKTEALKPRKRNSKYNKDNTLYIAYDFNILGNKSFAEVNRIMEKRKIDKLTKDKFPAVKTTSVLFFNYSYTVSDFEDVILVRKNGSSISIKNLYDNPGYYIPKKYQKGFSLDNCIYQEGFSLEYDIEGMNDVSGLMHAIYAGIVRFKKEKEI